MIMNTGDKASLCIGLDPADHCEVANLGAGGDGARDPRDESALLLIGRAADNAESAINARVRQTAGRRDSCQRRRRPLDPDRLSALSQDQRGCVQFMRAIGIAGPLGSPRIVDRAGYLQRLFYLAVIIPHLAPIDRPVSPIAQLAF